MTDEEMMKHFVNRRDDQVSVGGRDYVYDGWIVGVFEKRRGGWRCNVEDQHGRVFIHAAAQLSEMTR